MDDLTKQPRMMGDYVLGDKIGSGSFAVVWKAMHRQRGAEFAVKEIDKRQLSQKVSENLLKEISILSTIDHPNIIRFFEAIQTKDRIYLVLEYCDGGDLGHYINRHGKVSEATAKHFMRQLASGMQVLHEKHLIHRDLKPQNLLLSSNDVAPQLKIADFGFARSLNPEDVADTLCGSPLYMAPEIIQNQKYDAKADLWSAGAILFQLVTGKPPFSGNSQYQLFQNILRSNELRFPQGALEELHPDCVDLCRSLLRRNPVERLTFKEFFNHKFLREPRNTKTSSSNVHEDEGLHGKDQGITPSTEGVHGLISHVPCDIMKSVDCDQCSTHKLKVSDSMDSIEKEYVLVNANFASMETSSYYLGTSVQDNSTTRVSICPSKKNSKEIAVTTETMELVTSPIGGVEVEGLKLHSSNSLASSCAFTASKEVQELSVLHPLTRLHLLRHCVQALAELAQEKYNAGLFLESFSLELVVLAIWERALEICGSWLASVSERELPESSSANKSFGCDDLFKKEDNIDFSKTSSVYQWAEQGFIIAFDRAEKLSSHIQQMDASAEMPDAMEIIFQKALNIGTSGAIDEYMGNKSSADASYSKAMLLLSFIVGEATTLPMNPPFSLTPADKKRIQSYIVNLQSHQSYYLTSHTTHKQFPDSLTK
ncbi:serine/threonine-protein kinase ATG1a isoform X2 [Tripterygium wilfordii]|uniref:serine/threonine-protein kinase ATG1a isoform X2 n=1 Tax=Tripterygium wilfordii TaxID=458696 RepID=UPI0018F7ECB3|nr:serine/threonine-protein kinase ATG1a isoform X2 [Tripterygium wilfordii]